MTTSIKPGIYEHYKGGLYEAYEVATHSETEELVVVYRPQYGEKKLWVRPLAMFIETIEVEGEAKPRFKYLREAKG